MSKLDIKALALAGGVLWGLYMLCLGFMAMFGWGTSFLSVMSSIYIGFRPTFPGAIVGGLWGFLDGAVAGGIIAFVYNLTARKV